MIAVAAPMMICGTFASAEIGAVASASGVRPKPASTWTFSLTIELLRDALGGVRDIAVVAHDQLDLLAGDLVAMLLHIKLGAALDLAAGRGERPGQRQDEADFHGVLRGGRKNGNGQRKSGRNASESRRSLERLPVGRRQRARRLFDAYSEARTQELVNRKTRSICRRFGPLGFGPPIKSGCFHCCGIPRREPAAVTPR